MCGPTYVQVVGATGAVVGPYFSHPRLLDSMIGALQRGGGKTSYNGLRLEVSSCFGQPRNDAKNRTSARTGNVELTVHVVTLVEFSMIRCSTFIGCTWCEALALLGTFKMATSCLHRRSVASVFFFSAHMHMA